MRKISVLILGTLFLISCDRSLPSGFWKNFRSELIEKSDSNQGPYGGKRSLFWSTPVNGTFSEKEVLEFASANKWEPVDSMTFTRKELHSWHHDGIPVFPIYFDGAIKIYSENNLSAYTAFERWIESDLKVYRCRTNWLLFYPGTDESTQENGYIIISQDGRQMTIYHLWGE